MSRNLIDYERVVPPVVHALIAEGIAPSAEKIKVRSGGGSLKSILKVYREMVARGEVMPRKQPKRVPFREQNIPSSDPRHEARIQAEMIRVQREMAALGVWTMAKD